MADVPNSRFALEQASPAGGSFVLPAATSLLSLLLLPLVGEII